MYWRGPLQDSGSFDRATHLTPTYGFRFHNRKISGSIPRWCIISPWGERHWRSAKNSVGSMQPPGLLSRMYGKPYVRVKWVTLPKDLESCKGPLQYRRVNMNISNILTIPLLHLLCDMKWNENEMKHSIYIPLICNTNHKYKKVNCKKCAMLISVQSGSPLSDDARPWQLMALLTSYQARSLLARRVDGRAAFYNMYRK